MFRLFKKKQEIKLLQQQEEEMNKIVELQQTINELYREEKEILKANFKTKKIKQRKNKKINLVKMINLIL